MSKMPDLAAELQALENQIEPVYMDSARELISSLESILKPSEDQPVLL